MEHWQVKLGAFLAPLRHWRVFIAAFAIPAILIGAASLSGVDVPADGMSRALLAATMCLALSAFEWVWINGLTTGLRFRLFTRLPLDRHFWVFTAVNSALFLFLQWQTPLREYLDTFGPVVRVIGDREIHEPLLGIALLQLFLVAIALWVRLRLVYWPTDIVLSRTLRPPLMIWRMTEGEGLSIFGLWLSFLASAAITVILPTYLLTLMLDESVAAYLWIFAGLYMIAVPDSEYIRTYHSIVGTVPASIHI